MTGRRSMKLRRRTTLALGIIRGELAIWGAVSRHKQPSHEGSWCQASRGQPSSFFFKLRSTAHRCRPVELWATHCVVQAQRQIHRVAGPVHRRWPENAFSDQDCRTTLTVSFRCDPWLEPIYRLRLDARRTSHPVAVSQNGWHHNPSFSRSSGSGGRVHPVFRHITATVCNGPPARIQRG